MKAIEKAVLFQWFSLSTFNLREYEAAATLEHGGFNWIVPGKVLAFVCPSNEIILQGPITPERYVQIFLKLGVTCIVRLNNKTYDSSRFTRHGIKHKELYFIDGSVPSENIVRGFVETLEEENVVAVHCKAGLGRTGTLIGCYAMKHFAITAEEFISWCRICRPGSILGPQQQFLCDVQEWCKKWAAGQEGDFGQSVKSNNMQGEEGFKARFGDYGQASRLQLKSNSPKARNSQRPRLGLSPRIKNYQLGKAESQALFNGKMYK